MTGALGTRFSGEINTSDYAVAIEAVKMLIKFEGEFRGRR
jgi:hypothetical protein